MAFEKDPNEIGALWAKESGSGMKYYSGVITIEGAEPLNIVVFLNKKKASEKAPDARILISRPREEEAPKKAAGKKVAAPSKPPKKVAPPKRAVDEDEEEETNDEEAL